MTVKIRPVKTTDLKILAEAYAKTYKNLAVGEKWTKTSALKFLHYWFKKQPDLSLLAEDRGRIVGAVFTAVKPYWDGNHLFDAELFVQPDYQNQGVGKILLKTVLIKAVKKYQVTVFEAYTFADKKFPLSWYEKIGLKKSKNYVMISGQPKKIISNI